MKTTPLAVGSLALALVATAGPLMAGPLNPPPGPVTSTYKTLTEVEPRVAINATNTPGNSAGLYTIRQPGSYYLTENLAGVAGRNGIFIDTPGAVTIDLNGFEVVGPGGTGDFNGIAAFNITPVSITIRNGTIRNWAGDGIDLVVVAAPSCSFIDLRIRNNGSSGISSGPGCTFINCIADDNGTSGFSTASGCVFANCIALSNNADGFLVGTGSTINGCNAYLNSGNGINAGPGSTISGCAARANSLDGIRVTSSCVVLSNACSLNGFNTTGAGIRAAGGDNRIEGNNCSTADRGIEVDSPGNIIIRNTCSGNTINWVIAANNVSGPIIDRTNPASAAISGNSAPDSTGSSHPNANFSY